MVVYWLYLGTHGGVADKIRAFHKVLLFLKFPVHLLLSPYFLPNVVKSKSKAKQMLLLLCTCAVKWGSAPSRSKHSNGCFFWQ